MSFIAYFFLLLGLTCTLLHLILKSSPPRRLLPPGPRALPVIGNLHMLGALPHRALQTLARTYGPVMSVRLGHVPTIVISSPEAAEQALKTHDAALASRPKILASEHLCYGTKGVAFTEYGPYWRFVRKLCTIKLLSTLRVESFAPLRRREVEAAVGRLREAAERREVVDLSERVSELVEEISFRMVFGYEIDIVDFKGLAKEGIRLIGSFNLADYVPFLAPFDFQGLTKQMVKLSKEIDTILDKIIDQVEQKSVEKNKQPEKNEKPAMSFIEVLLSLMNQPIIDNRNEDQDQDYTVQMTNVKAVLVDIIAASFDTSVTAIEWTLSELLKHPNIMARVQQELNDMVGLERMVEEADLPNLNYFEMVVMESFRLHPVAPFLIPRESMQNVEISGYFVPKKTRVLVNAWAIGRDPNVWSNNAEEFVPERYLDHSEMDFRGNDFRFIPFGSGRRGCPGLQLGLTAVRLVVAQLVHCFSWELPNGMSPCELDMTEKFGLTIPRAKHLLASPTYRLS